MCLGSLYLDSPLYNLYLNILSAGERRERDVSIVSILGMIYVCCSAKMCVKLQLILSENETLLFYWPSKHKIVSFFLSLLEMLG